MPRRDARSLSSHVAATSALLVRVVVAYADDLAGPVRDVAPRRNARELLLGQSPRRPLHEVAELLAAKRFGASNRTPTLRRLWHRIAVLDPLDSKHDQHRIRPSAGKGRGQH